MSARTPQQAADEWMALVNRTADHMRENAAALRKLNPDMELEARARELAALQLVQVAGTLAADARHLTLILDMLAAHDRMDEAMKQLEDTKR